MEPKTWDIIEEEKLGPNIARKMFWGENIMVTRWELAPDTTLPVHDHISEQVTIVERGSVTVHFPNAKDVVLHEGDMLVIPPSEPHSVTVGPRGCTAMDLFSPIRHDFIESRGEAGRPPEETEEDKYVQLQGFLASAGIELPLDQLLQVPLEVLARYVYDRECITMGQLRKILELDKKQAKELLRQWKHGDDHSESSLKRKMERLIVLPWER